LKKAIVYYTKSQTFGKTYNFYGNTNHPLSYYVNYV